MSETKKDNLEKMAEFLDANTTKPEGWGLGEIQTNHSTIIFHYEPKEIAVGAWVVMHPQYVPICHFHNVESLAAFINSIKLP